mmetsp:Transcript_25984/g.29998  ORF Transcript_25984/g.29998 Transcript_25984/m.29998 type:complete len:94 (+) Transcript_25984:168-449(+)
MFAWTSGSVKEINSCNEKLITFSKNPGQDEVSFEVQNELDNTPSKFTNRFTFDFNQDPICNYRREMTRRKTLAQTRKLSSYMLLAEMENCEHP